MSARPDPPDDLPAAFALSATPQSPEFEHATTLPFVIVRLAATLRQAFAEAMAEEDLTPPHFGVLAQFSGEEPRTAAAIARAISLTPQAVGPHIDALVSRGLITRTPRPGRGRPNELRLTPEGMATLERAVAIARAERDRVVGHLSAEEQRAMVERLREIAERARRPPGSGA